MNPNRSADFCIASNSAGFIPRFTDCDDARTRRMSRGGMASCRTPWSDNASSGGSRFLVRCGDFPVCHRYLRASPPAQAARTVGAEPWKGPVFQSWLTVSGNCGIGCHRRGAGRSTCHGRALSSRTWPDPEIGNAPCQFTTRERSGLAATTRIESHHRPEFHNDEAKPVVRSATAESILTRSGSFVWSRTLTIRASALFCPASRSRSGARQ